MAHVMDPAVLVTRGMVHSLAISGFRRVANKMESFLDVTAYN